MVAGMIISVTLFFSSLDLSFPTCMMHSSQHVLLGVDGLLSLEHWPQLEPRIYPGQFESLHLEALGMQPSGNEAKLVLPKKMPIWKMTSHVCAAMDLPFYSCQNVLCLALNES